MYDYEIRKLNNRFYMDYLRSLYPEILTNVNRNYNIVLFALSSIKACYIGVPFRSKMHHNNGYKFKYSKRSQQHVSGLDFSQLVIINKSIYIGQNSMVDSDEFNEFYIIKDIIHKN
ncbi:MAG: hypothetical protein LUH02_09825 [Erysipelotrichaceae bacterium]|nr:hypothetical protein [Erysipelotrichaceae bacterium]